MSNISKKNSSVLSAIIVGVAIAVIPATLGYIVSYVDGIRNDRLVFINEQIEKLYGPLHALAQANDVTWKEFVATGRAPDWSNPSKEQIMIWRVWMQNVLQPINIKIEETIANNSQLVVGDGLPRVFQTVIAHTESYKALISTWKLDDIDKMETYTSKKENTTNLPFPDKLDLCVSPIYTALKKHQIALQNNIFQVFLLDPVSIPPECNDQSCAAEKL